MMDEIVHRFSQDGAEVEDVALPAEFCDVIQRHRIVMAVEGAQYHETRLQRHPEDYLPRIRQLLEEGLACPAPEYSRTKDHQKELTAIMWNAFNTGKQVVLCPATTGPALGRHAPAIPHSIRRGATRDCRRSRSKPATSSMGCRWRFSWWQVRIARICC